MKIVVTRIAAACAAFVTVGAATPALAQYLYDQPYYAVAVVPPRAVMTIVRSQGFAPISRPTLRGVFYVVRAVEEDRVAVRIVVDGRTGRIVRVTETGELRDGRVVSLTPPENIPLAVPPGAASVGEKTESSSKTSAERIPLPRAAPVRTRVAATPPQLPPNMAAVVNEPTASGKSVPAPVGGASPATTGSIAPPATAGQTNASASSEPADDASPPKPRVRSVGAYELQPTVMVPVAPLE